MNSQMIYPILFSTLLFMFIVWFVLLKLLFNRLERTHPKKYEEMGRPSLFLRNNISNGGATLKFLFSREHKALNDRNLSKLSDAMLVVITIYVLVFFALFFMGFIQTTSNAV